MTRGMGVSYSPGTGHQVPVFLPGGGTGEEPGRGNYFIVFSLGDFEQSEAAVFL